MCIHICVYIYTYIYIYYSIHTSWPATLEVHEHCMRYVYSRNTYLGVTCELSANVTDMSTQHLQYTTKWLRTLRVMQSHI